MNTNIKVIITAIILIIISVAVSLTQGMSTVGILLSPVCIVIFAVVMLLNSSTSINTSTNNSTTTSKKASSTVNQDKNSSDDTLATLYVGNISYKATEDDLKNYFQTFTTVHSVRLLKDKRTGKKKGFGFIEVSDSDANKTIEKYNESIFFERNLIVRHAKEKVG
ncbi:RNA recognition motif domain-containing protein [Glaciecola sp. 1036]|uniref:RNA recognition motif domain-containing protein n=1 Tax=Alteromonadaceae TaxID=72275 RepID=UPI003D00E705